MPGRLGGLAAEIHNFAEINLLEVPNATNLKKICIGFAVFSPNNDDTKTDAAFLRILDSDGNAFLSLSTTENNYSTVTLYKSATSVSVWPDGELISTYVRQNKWNYFEIYLKITDGPNGVITIKCNNQVIYNYIGNTTTSTAGDDTFNTIQFGVAAEVGVSFDEVESIGSENILIDDVYLADNFVDNAYISSIKYLIPIEDGKYNEWIPHSIESLTNHYEHVDEIPSNDLIDYISGYITNESYILDNLSINEYGDITGVIHCISIDNCAYSNDFQSVNNLIVFEDTDYIQDEFSTIDAWRNYIDVVQNNPATGLPWTIDEINEVETGLTYGFID